MALRDDIQDLITTEIGLTRYGKLFLEQGYEGIQEAGFDAQEMLAGLNAVLTAHRNCLIRLADEIDALRD